jgi:hypothetical protein
MNVYICLFTTSEPAPTPRSNTAVSSKIGVSIGSYPARAKESIARRVTACHAHDPGGRRSLVPLGASNERSVGVMGASYGAPTGAMVMQAEGL